MLWQLDDLHALDIEENRIKDYEQIQYLSMIHSLQSLSIYGNPITRSLEHIIKDIVITVTTSVHPWNVWYRNFFILACKLNISTLDDKPVSDIDSLLEGHDMEFQLIVDKCTDSSIRLI
jgi:hypothetical protein